MLYHRGRSHHSNTAMASMAALDLPGCAASDDACLRPCQPERPSAIRRNHVGSALMAPIGSAPDGKPVDATAEALVLSGLENGQRRCLRQREPSYEDLRFQLDDDPHLFF